MQRLISSSSAVHLIIDPATRERQKQKCETAEDAHGSAHITQNLSGMKLHPEIIFDVFFGNNLVTPGRHLDLFCRGLRGIEI